MKIHLCCGDIYLIDYINIDIEGQLSSTALPNNLANNSTTLGNYFKYSFGTPRRSIIVDKLMDITKPWDIESNSIDEIVMISAIEHFKLSEAQFIVSEVKRVLKSGGEFKFDFPDLRKDILEYYHKPDFLMELIYCNWKNPYSTHKWGYTIESARELLDMGWKYVFPQEIVKHDYPMQGMIGIKK